jgi:hypothetical protein
MLIHTLIQLLKGMLNFDFEKITKHFSKMHNQLVAKNMTFFVVWKAINHHRRIQAQLNMFVNTSFT